jgi:hypothetical protein
VKKMNLGTAGNNFQIVGVDEIQSLEGKGPGDLLCNKLTKLLQEVLVKTPFNLLAFLPHPNRADMSWADLVNSSRGGDCLFSVSN